MKYLILCLVVALSTISSAETLEQLKARMLQDGAAKGVIAVGEENGQRGTFMPNVSWIVGSPDIYYCRVVWVIDNGNTIKKDGKDVLYTGEGEAQTVFGWLGDEPDFLKVTADAYITGRTSAAASVPKRPFTKAEVESFCNTLWRGAVGSANYTARDVIEFTVDNVNSNTIRVQGLFHDVAANQRLRLIYLISMVDPNGAISGTNVKFEKVIE